MLNEQRISRYFYYVTPVLRFSILHNLFYFHGSHHFMKCNVYYIHFSRCILLSSLRNQMIIPPNPQLTTFNGFKLHDAFIKVN